MVSLLFSWSPTFFSPARPVKLVNSAVVASGLFTLRFEVVLGELSRLSEAVTMGMLVRSLFSFTWPVLVVFVFRGLADFGLSAKTASASDCFFCNSKITLKKETT